MVTLDQINFTVVGIVALVAILVIVGVGYGAFLLLGGSGDNVDVPSANNYSLESTDSGDILVSQTKGELQTEQLMLEISYDDATSESRNITLNSVGSEKTITPNKGSATLTGAQLRWVGDETVNLGQITIDTSNGTSDPPQDQLSIDNVTLQLGESLQLDASERVSNADSYLWNLDRGIVYSEANITHEYTSAGKYNASLTITKSNGDELSDNFTVTVTDGNESDNTSDTNQSEYIEELMVPDEVNVSEPVVFDVIMSGEENSQLNYTWSTNGVEYEEKTPTHTYNESGSYNVSLDVNIGGIDYASESRMISVVDSQTDTNESDTNETDTNETQVNGTSANIKVLTQNNLTVEFSGNDSVFNESISTYEWSPEPGVSDDTSTPEYNYTYSSEGNYTVQLTLVTESGDTDTDSITVNVSNSTDSNQTDTNESDTNETDTNETQVGEPDIIVEMDNKGDQYWTVKSVSGTDVNNVLPSDDTGDNNPDIHLEIGQRYKFTGIPTEPWEENVTITFADIVRKPLLSQDEDGKYNTDSSVGWIDENSSVEFTVTSEFGENVTTYYAPQNENQMKGNIVAD